MVESGAFEPGFDATHPVRAFGKTFMFCTRILWLHPSQPYDAIPLSIRLQPELYNANKANLR